MAELTGMGELRRAFEDAVTSIVKAAERAADASAGSIRDDMRRHVPVASGALKRGIEDRKRDTLTHEVGVRSPKLYYAVFIEHGTSSMPAQPFALPAAERERRKFPQRVTDAINKELT